MQKQYLAALLVGAIAFVAVLLFDSVDSRFRDAVEVGLSTSTVVWVMLRIGDKGGG